MFLREGYNHALAGGIQLNNSDDSIGFEMEGLNTPRNRIAFEHHQQIPYGNGLPEEKGLQKHKKGER
jgi:hypothetical protein